MRGLLKWPNTSFSYLLYSILFGLPYILETQDKSYFIQLEDRKHFPAACIYWAAALVSMLRKFRGNYLCLDQSCYHLIN